MTPCLVPTCTSAGEHVVEGMVFDAHGRGEPGTWLLCTYHRLAAGIPAEETFALEPMDKDELTSFFAERYGTEEARA